MKLNTMKNITKIKPINSISKALGNMYSIKSYSNKHKIIFYHSYFYASMEMASTDVESYRFPNFINNFTIDKLSYKGG